MFQFAYITADAIMATVWLVLFLWRKDLRKEMLTMSGLSLVWITLSFSFFVHDWYLVYHAPEVLMPIIKGVSGEDILYAIFFGGIAAVLYEELLGKKHFKKARKKSAFTEFLLFPLFIFLGFFAGIRIFHMNAYIGSYIGFTLAAGYIWIKQRSLFAHSLASGLFLALSYLLFGWLIFLPLFPGIVAHWWHMQYLSGMMLLGIPAEEILWAFFFGMFIGPSYEFLMGLKDK